MTTDTTTEETAQEAAPWRARLENLEIGRPKKHSGLCVYPLLGADLGRTAYTLLEAALAAGTVTIKEKSVAGSVPTLTLTNTGGECVFLLDGEELLGAKQNRIVNTSVLAGPSAALSLPVTCVEAGRWRQDTAQFASGGSHYNARGRQRKVAEVSASLARSGRADSDQGRVWSDISGKLARLAVPSRTAALHDITERYESDLGAYAEALAEAVPGQIGAVFALGREIVGADLFDRPRTLAGLLPKLTASYALDALEETSADAPPPASVVAAWLESAARADARVHPAVGLGRDLRLSGPKLSGAALEYADATVHLSLFAAAQDRLNEDRHSADLPGTVRPATRIARPSVRRG